jgi:hypothetical protein
MKRAGGGGKRGGRKPTRVESDDRPRGYEATRMRRLWHDIDHAKRKAGLGPAPAPPAAPSWDVTAMLERAVVLAGEVAAWMAANAPAACAAALANASALLRNVPVVGHLIELVPTPPALESGAPKNTGHADAPSNHHTNGNARAVIVDPDDPDRGWLH